MKGNTFIQNWLDHVFLNAAVALIGDASGLQPAGTVGSLYVSLHTADPGAAGSQLTSETGYTGYNRVAVTRNGSGWSRSAQTVTNVADVTFPECTAGSSTITHVGVGTASGGAGKLLYSWPLVSTIYDFTAKTSDTLTAPGHALVVDDPVVFMVVPGATIPTGITAGTTYFVKTVSGDDFTISATQGGATLDVTVAGSGIVGKLNSLAVSNLITPKFSAGQLTISEM